MKKDHTGAIVLAAGKGTRMESKSVNKVTLALHGKPLIVHTTELLKDLNLSPIVVVVGFAKNSVSSLFKNGIIFAEQKKRLGTAHAVSTALKEIPADISNVLILQGDDSAFYRKETIAKLIKEHEKNGSAFTFLTIEVENPMGLGRILRDEKGHLMGIVEEKDATDAQKLISEINPACYVASTSFLRKYLNFVKKSSITGEYYLTSLIDIAINNNEKVQAIKGGQLAWRGVNTKEELEQAHKLFLNIK